MPDRAMSFRMDFESRIISFDEDTHTFVVQLVPNPRRYEWKLIEGKRGLYDRLDNTFFPEEVLAELANQLVGLPMSWQPQRIDDAEQYVRSRKPCILAMLKGHDSPGSFEDKSEAFLESLADDKWGFVIMSVDIVGSTSLSTRLDARRFSRLISTVLYEMSEVIPKFHGHVLKYTGDGLIAYFPEPSFITKHDLAIDCALTVRRLVYKGLNPILTQEGYPNIDIRVGLDSGEASVITIGSPETKQHKDIIGAIVSLATKIQSIASPGGIFLGDMMQRNLHTMWRQICEPVKLGEQWSYKGGDGQPYMVHKVKFQ